jgi:hypothetical protein
MKNFLVLLCIFLCLCSFGILKATDDGKFGVDLTGFVKTDVFFDTRENVSLREGHFLLYPQPVSKDINGKDINEKANFNILSIQTRLAAKISAPDVLGAKTSAYFESEFFGSTDGNINSLRLRHAYVKLDWATTSLLVGQYWHPFFVVECYPEVLSFNTGAPFQPFTRNPQIRLSQHIGDLRIDLSALTQRDFTSNGPIGSVSDYLRNSAIPDMSLGLQYAAGKDVFGIAGDIKVIQPRLSATINNILYKTDETVASAAAEGYLKLVFDQFTIKAEGVWGQNLADMLMIGGYADKSVDLLGKYTYTPISCGSVWGELMYGSEMQVGLFAGYTANLGAMDNYIRQAEAYGRALNIESILRVSPRFVYNSGKFRFAGEIEYTGAKYGTPTPTDKGLVHKLTLAENVRVLLGFYVFF